MQLDVRIPMGLLFLLLGDQLRIEVEVGKIRSKTGQVLTKAFVGTELVAEAELMFALVEK